MKRMVLFSVIFCCAVAFCFPVTAGGLMGRSKVNNAWEEAVWIVNNSTSEEQTGRAELAPTSSEKNTRILRAVAEPEEEVVPERRKAKAFTLMVYLCGSNLEADCDLASKDILEMMRSGFDSQKMNVLVMTGGSKEWKIPEVPADKKSIWEVCPEVYEAEISQVNPEGLTDEQAVAVVLKSIRAAMKLVVRDDAANMGDPQTLKEFLGFSQAYYPAEKYGLILWNHGAGPNKGVCIDELFDKDLMSIPELTDALSGSPFAEEPLEWIGFDACLMGSAEVAAKLVPYARYMIASEDMESGYGWNYGFIRDIAEDATGAETGQRIIDAYVDNIIEICRNDRVELTATMACIDLSGMEQVCSASERLFKALDQELDVNSYVEFAKARENATAFGHSEGGKADFDYDLIDLDIYLDLLTVGNEALCKEMKEALAGSVSYSRSTMDGARGLSIYYPYYCTDAFADIEPDYRQLSVSEAYLSFIRHAYRLQVGAPQADWSEMNTDTPHLSDKDIRTIFMLALNEDQVRLLAEARLQVFRKEGDAYSLVADVPETDFDSEAGTLTAEYIHRALFVTDTKGEPLSPALPYIMDGDGNYEIEANLTAHDNEGNELARSKVLLKLKKKAGSDDTEIVSIQKWDDALECYSPRFNILLTDYNTMEITCQLKTPEGFVDGTLLAWDEWLVTGEATTVCSLKDGQKLKLLHDRQKQDALYASFAIRDYQNRRYLSSLKGFTEKPDLREAVIQYDDKDVLTLENASLLFNNSEMGRSAVLTMNLKNLTDHEMQVRVDEVLLDQEETDLTTDLFGDGPNWGILYDESQRLILNIPVNVLSGREDITQIDFVLTLEFEDASTKEVPVRVLMNVQAEQE